jgi:hypothetical protein
MGIATDFIWHNEYTEAYLMIDADLVKISNVVNGMKVTNSWVSQHGNSHRANPG